MTIGITLGDVSGIGPEIVLKTFLEKKLPPDSLVIGDCSVLEECCRILGWNVPLRPVSSFSAVAGGKLNVYDLKNLDKSEVTPGVMNKQSGFAALEYLRCGVTAALDRKLSAIVTLPMNKEATRLSTPGFTGHTEVIQEMCGGMEFTMTLATDTLLVTHVSSHVSLRDALDRVKRRRIVGVIQLTHGALVKLRRQTRIAVMGLNPHAGEHGAFGSEEELEVAPAVREAQMMGMCAIGPLPPDTVFMRALAGEFDAVVCMYHDQGHIPMKTVGFHDTVQMTVGLPIVRTSVDHGTAFDIAYKGKASIGSFVAACRMAQLLG